MAESMQSGVTTDDPVLQPVVRLTEALNSRDLDTVLRAFSEDCVFENTYPAPDGTRYEGLQELRLFWTEFFRSNQQSSFEIEEIFALGDRCVMRWSYHWLDTGGQPGHIRGVDIYRVKNGKISEKLSYVKG